MFLAGDSAGGGLALALMLNLRDLGAPGPTAACLFSPWTDLVGTGASIAANRNRDPLLTMDGIEDLVAVYAGGVDPRTPLISPLFGDFAGLAPMIVFVGDTELLLDDSRQLADRAARAGVPVDLRVYPDMPHVWPTMNVFLREGRRALDEAAAFLKGAEGEAAG
jgi:acetyl esterase/lipase